MHHMPRPKIDRHPARLSVSLDPQDYEEVCRIAVQQDVSAAWVVRRAVQDFLGSRKLSLPISQVTPLAREARGEG